MFATPKSRDVKALRRPDLSFRSGQDLYPIPLQMMPNLLIRAPRFNYPDDRRAALVRALTPLNKGNPSLKTLAQPGTVAIVTGQQVGLFSGPAYTVYKALTAIKSARDLTARGVPAVPVFWLATEDHDFAEVNHVWVFGADHQPVRIAMDGHCQWGAPGRRNRTRRYSARQICARLWQDCPSRTRRWRLIERAYRPGETMGSAFADVIRATVRVIRAAADRPHGCRPFGRSPRP